MNIKSVHARQVLDSRGNPTVACEVTLADGGRGRAIVPSGASTGRHEALELRDGDPAAFGGKGVLRAVANVNERIAPAVIGQDAAAQQQIDKIMLTLDGTDNKSELGANAILAVSLAVAHAAADGKGVPLWQHLATVAGVTNPHILPTPMMNVINGGAHADSGLPIQEFMIVPTGATSFAQALQYGAETFHQLKKILAARGESTAVGDEGGFAPHLPDTDIVVEVLLAAIEAAGHTGKIQLAIDAAANDFYNAEGGCYKFYGDKTADEMIAFYAELVDKYPFVSIEDGLDEDDWTGFTKLQTALGDRQQLVGDDLLVTNSKRLRRAIDEQASNAILIKVNQIGSLTETIETVQMAQQAGWNTVISHRSGETEDTTIADLAVALNAGQIKTGSLCRSERVAKYNRLLQIEAELGDAAEYFGEIK